MPQINQAVLFIQIGKDGAGYPTMRLHDGVVRDVNGSRLIVEAEGKLHRVDAMQIRGQTIGNAQHVANGERGSRARMT